MPEVIYKSFAEYWGYYWRVTSRRRIPGLLEWDKRLVDLILRTTAVPAGAKVLDLGCGGGDQARVFAGRGYEVTGIDMVPALVDYAREAFAAEGLRGEFTCGDMRDIDYQACFDLCLLLSGTFGFFSDRENEAQLRRIHRALRPGGKAFIMYLSASRYAARKRTRTWKPIDGGLQLSEHWYHTETGTYRSTVRHIMANGEVIVPAAEPGYHANEVIRCYTVPEIERLFRDAGFAGIEHLPQRCIDEPDCVPADWEPRDIVVARRA